MCEQCGSKPRSSPEHDFCEECSNLVLCDNCKVPLNEYAQLDENNKWICPTCKQLKERNFELCRACNVRAAEWGVHQGLCSHCFSNKEEFYTSCRLCSNKFKTRDLLLMECGDCISTTHTCVKCSTKFDAPSPESELCEKCLWSNGCTACGKRVTEDGSNYCRVCNFNIANSYCTGCGKDVSERTVSHFGECTYCQRNKGKRTEHYNRKLCVFCYVNESTSSADFMCNSCREIASTQERLNTH